MNNTVDVLANIIIQYYFYQSRCLFLFTDTYNNFTYTENIPIIQVVTSPNHIPEDIIFQYFGCQEIVIKSNNPLTLFKEFEQKIRYRLERFNNRKYLFIPGTNMSERFVDISKMNELNYVSNLLLLVSHPFSEAIDLMTHKYVTKTDNKKLYLLDKWFVTNQTFLRNTDLFPNKLINQMGRELKMATFQYEPYSVLGSTVKDYRGSEMSTILEFAKFYNMSPVPVVNKNDYWGDIFEDFTGIGLLGNIANDKADLGFAALYTWEIYYHYLDLSKPLVRTGITCLVPAPKLAAGWLTPLFSYSYAMWSAVIALFAMCIIALFFINSCYNRNNFLTQNRTMESTKLFVIFGNAMFSISKLFILQTVTKQEIPYGKLGKYFMGLVFLLSLFLSSTYSSGLSSIMTIPRYENPINTVKEFANSKLSWGGTQDAWVTSIKDAEEAEYVKIVDRFVAKSEEQLRQLSLEGEFAFSLERLPEDNYAIGAYIQKDVISNFHLMQEDFYWEQCVVMTKKSSILLPMLNIFILRVFEAGLISVWQNEAVVLSMDTSVQRVVNYFAHHGQEKVVFKLKFQHVEGAFAILVFGYLISFIAFIIEIIQWKINTDDRKFVL